jgi:hypothetical protein
MALQLQSRSKTINEMTCVFESMRYDRSQSVASYRKVTFWPILQSKAGQVERD